MKKNLTAKGITIVFISLASHLSAQVKSPVKISGNAGVSYDGYGLTTNPKTPSFYTPRKPWNLVRFNFQPTISAGNFKIPFNFNFSPMRNNFGGVPFGFGSLPGFPKQTFGQWISNPINSFGINPTYKWAEVQLGTQYLKYSELSTGDIGAFGYGFSLKPGKYRFKLFHGVSQQAFQPYTGAGTPPDFAGAYKRNVTMGQIGLEKEGVYFAGFNIVKGKDEVNSIAAPISTSSATTPKPQENVIVSFAANFTYSKGWFGQTELASTFTTRDKTAAAPSPVVKDFKPLLNTNMSSYHDHAIQVGMGKKSKNLELGAGMKWLGAGYNTMGYPFVQNDRMEYTVNTKFNAWKNKINFVGSIGQRFGNWSQAAGPRTKQIIGNANLFSQLNDHLSVNASYNNYGFTTSGLGAVRNVGNDLGINPTYTWQTSKMSNLVSLNYNWSKYTETTFIFPFFTSNNTHTGLLLYAPSIFSKPNLSPDFSVMYFYNSSSFPSKIGILSASTSLGWNLPKKKVGLRGQLQYNITTVNPNTSDKNLLATLGADVKLNKMLTWNTAMSGNVYRYGNILSPIPPLLGARYLESTFHTSLQFRFGK